MLRRRRSGTWRFAPLLAVWALLCSSGFVAPSPDWDAIPYAALAAQRAGEADPKARAYADLAAIVPLDSYVTGRYRQAAFADDAVFRESLRFYAERAGYTLINAATGRLAGNYVRGLQVTSAIAGVVALFAVFLLLRDGAGMGFGPAAALGLAIGLASGLVNFSRFLSPDILAAALLLLAVHAYVTGRIAAQVAWSLAMVTARPDFVLFPLALAGCDLVLRLRRGEFAGLPRQAAPALAAALAALAGWAWLRATMDHPGWAAIVNFTLLLGPDSLQLQAGQVDWRGYLRMLAEQGILALYKEPRFVMAMAFLGFAAWWWLRRGRHAPPPGRLQVAAAASAAFVLGHVLLFPVAWDRFFTGSYAVIMVAVLAAAPARAGMRAGSLIPARMVACPPQRHELPVGRHPHQALPLTVTAACGARDSAEAGAQRAGH